MRQSKVNRRNDPQALRARSSGEAVSVSVLVLAVGSFTIIGASAMAPLYSGPLGLNEVGIGAVASVAYLGALLTAPFSGRVTDRAGPTRVIVAGLLSLSVGSLLAGLAWQGVVLFAGVLLAGFGYGAVNPATTVLANPRTSRRRALVMSIKQAGVPMGGVLAGLVLPVVGQAVGWRLAFGMSTTLCLMLGVTIASRRGYAARRRGQAVKGPESVRRLRLPVGYTFGLVIAGIQVSIFAFTAVYLVDGRGFTVSRAGLGVSTVLVGGVVGRLFWGWFADLFPKHRLRILEAIGLLGAISLAGVVLVPDAQLAPCMIALGFCSVGWNGVYLAVVAESSEPNRIGASTGLSLAMINLGAIVGPIGMGLLVAWTSSWTTGFLALAGMSVVATVVVWIAGERVQTPSEGMEAMDESSGGLM